MDMRQDNEQVELDQIHVQFEADTKVEEAKDIAAAQTIAAEIEADDALIAADRVLIEAIEKKIEELKTTLAEMRDKEQKEQALGDTTAQAEIEKNIKELTQQADKEAKALEEKIDSLKKERDDIIQKWGSSTFQEGLAKQAANVADGMSKDIMNSYKSDFGLKDAMNIEIAMPGKEDKITLENWLIERINERQREFENFLKDPNTSKDKMLLELKALQITREIKNDIKEFNHLIEQYNTLHPKNRVQQVKVPDETIRHAAKYANELHDSKLTQYHENIRSFHRIEELKQREAKLLDVKNGLADKAAELNNMVMGANAPLAPPVAPPLSSSTISVRPSNINTTHDPDAGTPYASDELNAALFKKFAKEIGDEMKKIINVGESVGQFTFGFGAKDSGAFSYDTLSKSFSTQGSDADSLRAMLMMANKAYPNQALDLTLDKSVDVETVKSISKELGIKVNIKVVEPKQSVKSEQASAPESRPTSEPAPSSRPMR